MESIWSDLQHIVVPTWLTSVPHNLGSALHGKLKADQWRFLGTAYLPLSLIRLWGLPTNDARSIRCREILEVTMHLVSAVIIATSHTTSTKNAESYLFHMQAYVTGIKRLFPKYKFVSNHHMAFHIKDYLVLFGPVHAWWTFPFERLIGMLQRMPNNGKIGELEETISASYTRAANLRALPLKAGCPEVLQNCEKIFAKLLDPYLRNTLPTDTNILDSLNDVDDLGESCDEDAMNPVPNDLKLALSAYLSSPAPRKA